VDSLWTGSTKTLFNSEGDSCVILTVIGFLVVGDTGIEPVTSAV
jgi:hypothetical protein